MTTSPLRPSLDPAPGSEAGRATVVPRPAAPPDRRVALDRLTAFFDPGTVLPLAGAEGAGMLAATGGVLGQAAVAFACDPTIQGGALGETGCGIVLTAYERALADGVPVIGLWQSGGARLRDGVSSLDAVGRVFAAMTRASGRIPQISVVLGPAAGGAAYGPALTDLVVMSDDGLVFVTGPDVVRSVTGEQVSAAELGGTQPHSRRSGVVHVTAHSASDALQRTRGLTCLLGSQRRLNPDLVVDRPLGRHLPTRVRRAYDVRPLVADLFDEPGQELQPAWAPNVVIALGRLGGRTVGVVANNPIRRGGCLDTLSAEKAARFVRMCDAFGVPLVVVVDVPGYLPGVQQEWDGTVRRGAKLLHAFAEATVPRVTVLTRKAYGGAYIAMNSRSLGATAVLAWPSAEVAVMGSVAAVRILHRREIAAAADRAATEQRLAAEHDRASGGLARAVAAGVVDEIVPPELTRSAIARALAAAPSRRGAHGNIPL